MSDITKYDISLYEKWVLKKKRHIYLEEEMVILKRNLFSPKHYFQDRDVKIIKVMKLA